MGGAATGLGVEGMRVVYGGRVAVAGASLSAPVGSVTGLIGPNGAGKTSILNGCNGMLGIAGGTVHLFGRDISRMGPAARARAGMGRTFQTAELCSAMTVRANVALGAEARLAGSNPLRQLAGTPRRRRAVAVATDEAMEICGVTKLANRPTAALSTGQRRLVELARVVGGDYRLLLLDEPSSGLDEAESHHFGLVLRWLVRDRQRGVLLVEHDMDLIMSICDRIYVVDFGHVIFEGTPADTQVSAIVRAAYLGSGDISPPGAAR